MSLFFILHGWIPSGQTLYIKKTRISQVNLDLHKRTGKTLKNKKIKKTLPFKSPQTGYLKHEEMFQSVTTSARLISPQLI